ncbi:hypothetical protein D7Z26_13055 [Cohnella endophytica]|uniref:Uncharacterized protein n=1 Tax=Cohnella endophytica TaxID=2419778 RepID=A0A494XUQ1_9BACL|nr:hypothetical protein [Cohnella endophytica]RKP54288.1 hypothetical protein D7Z26_13055 [Cohnella endophytica]
MRIGDGWLERQFEYSDRHGIPIPSLECEWEELSLDCQTAILERWELIRGSIPDRIMGFEAMIRIQQQRLFEEEDFIQSCRINGEIADLASRINDLNIWFRTSQDLSGGGESKQHVG